MPREDWKRLPSWVSRRLRVKKDRSDGSGSKLTLCLTPLDAYCLCMGALIRSVFWELPNLVDHYGCNVVFSMALAGVASVVTVYTYSELAAIFPSTSYAYDYVYHFMGELPAFLVGWTIILCMTVRLVCLSSYFGELLHFSIFKEVPAPANYSFMFLALEEKWYLIKLKNSPDYYTMGAVLVFSSIYFFQFKKQKTVNTVIVIFGIIALLAALSILWFNVQWWKVPFNAFRNLKEVGEFLYGCFLMYLCLIEVEVLLCLGEEIENPTSNIPKILSSIIKHVCTGYFIALYLYSAAALTEGYQSDVRLPVASILSNFGLPPKSLLIVFGSICVQFSTMYSRIHILTRVMYTMSKDGLLLKCFSFIDLNTRAPIVACCALLVINFAVTVFLKPTHLILRVARCGTLMVKILMAVCVLISRYQCADKRRRRLRKRWILINFNEEVHTPTPLTEYVSLKLILITTLCCILVVLMFNESLVSYNSFVRTALVLCVVLALCSSFALYRQPKNVTPYARKYLMGVPFVPFLGIMWDLGMLIVTGIPPLILLLCWMALGLVHYFAYSIHYSKRKEDVTEEESYVRRSRASSQGELSDTDIIRTRSTKFYL